MRCREQRRRDDAQRGERNLTVNARAMFALARPPARKRDAFAELTSGPRSCICAGVRVHDENSLGDSRTRKALHGGSERRDLAESADALKVVRERRGFKAVRRVRAWLFFFSLQRPE